LNTWMNTFTVEVKNTDLLWAETLASNIFMISFILDISVTSYLTGGGFYCIPEDPPLWDQLYNKTFYTIQNHGIIRDYINLTCGSEIKFASWPFYLIRILYIVLAVTYMLFNKFFMQKINRYESVLTGQLELVQFVGFHQHIKEIDYEESLVTTSKQYIRVKIMLLPFYTIFLIGALLIQYIIYSNLIIPVGLECGGPNHRMIFNRERIAFHCHFSLEWLLFLLSILSDTLKVILLFLYFLTISNLRHYIKYINKGGFSCNIDSSLTVGYGKKPKWQHEETENLGEKSLVEDTSVSE